MHAVGFLFGLGFGFIIAAVRLNEYDVIHNMLLLRDWEPYLFMASAIGVAAPLLWLLERRRFHTPLAGRLLVGRSPLQRHHLGGAAVFGTGWAVAGTCPVPAATLLGNGTLLGIVVVAGILGGSAVRDGFVARRAQAEDALDTAMAPAPLSPIVS